MEIQIRIIGVLLIVLSLAHSIFPSYFNWKNDLKHIQLVNRQMMWVHTFFVALIVFMMGVLCLICTEDLMHTQLGNTLCFGFGIFWFIRLLIQFFGYSSKLWKGKKLETVIHVIFSLLWIYLSYTFLSV